MNNISSKTKYLVYTAIIAAIYATLTYALAPLSYGPVQFRISEALTILPFFSSFPILGLTLGCLISNILSPYGILDIIFGTLATLISGILTYMIGKSNLKFKKILAPLPPVIVNGIVIGILLNLSIPSGPIMSNLFGISINIDALIPTMLSISLGQLVPCYVIGLPLLHIIEKNKNLKKQFQIKL